MADDVNKPKGFQGTGGETDLERLFRRITETNQPGAQEAELRRKRAEFKRIADEEINRLKQSGLSQQELIEKASDLYSPLKSLDVNIAGRETARSIRGHQMFQGGIARFTSERQVSHRLAQVPDQPGAFGAALSLSSQMPYEDLLARGHREAQRAQSMREHIENLSQDPANADLEDILRSERVAVGYERRSAITGLAAKHLRRQGLHTEGIYSSGKSLVGALEREQRMNSVRDEVMGGGDRFGGSQGERLQRLDSITTSLIDTFKKFDEAVKTGSNDVGKLGQQLRRASAEFQDQQEAVRAGEEQAAQVLNQRGQMFMAGSVAARFGANITRVGGVEVPLRKMSVQRGMADLANLRYQDVRAAAENYDVSAASRLMSYNNIDALSRKIYEAERLSMGLDVAGDVGSAVGFGAGAVAGFKTGGFRGAIASMGSALNSTGQAVRNVRLMEEGIPQGEAYLKAQNIARGLHDSLNMMRNVNVQSAVDFTTATGMATRGAGGGRNQLLGGLLDETFMSSLAGLGIGPDEIAQLTEQGVQGLGGAFNANMLNKAGRMQRAGVMNTGQFMQQAAGLGGVGGGIGTLEQSIRQMTKASMGNAKSMQELTNATIQLSAGFAAAGQTGTAGGTSALLAGAMPGLQHLHERQRMSVATSTLGTLNKMATSTDMDLFNVQEMALLRQAFPKIMNNIPAQQAALRLSPSAVRGIRDAKSAEDRVRAANSAGAGEFLLNEAGTDIDFGALGQLESIQRKTLSTRLMNFSATPEQRRLIDSIISGQRDLGAEPLNNKESAMVSSVGQGFKDPVSGKTIVEMIANISGQTIGGAEPNVKPGGMSETIERGAGIRAGAQLKPIIQGLNNMGGQFKDGMDKINDTFKTISDIGLGEMQENAKKAAETFEAISPEFKESVGSFSAAVKDFEDVIKEFRDQGFFKDSGNFFSDMFSGWGGSSDMSRTKSYLNMHKKK